MTHTNHPPLSRPQTWSVAGHLTLSSCASGWRRLCCWMAMGGGRGTVSAPSSPSSSPQLCMPDDEDLESVPLLRPSLRTLCLNLWKKENNPLDFLHRIARRMFNELCQLVHKQEVAEPPPESHPGAWRHYHPSLSVILFLHSFWRHGSSCVCEPVSSHGRRLYRCWVSSQDLSAISVKCCQGASAQGNSGSPSRDLAAGLQMSLAWWHHYCKLRERLQNEERLKLTVFVIG